LAARATIRRCTYDAATSRRERVYRGGKPPLEIAGKTVVLVDDRMATGATMRAAVVAARKLAPARIVVAVRYEQRSPR
jgi:putative phosphoribosyl transferase